MARSVALSPQFGNTVAFGSGFAGRRRRVKSVHMPLPEGLRVVAVCVPEEAEEAPLRRAGRPRPHRTPVAGRPSQAARVGSARFVADVREPGLAPHGRAAGSAAARPRPAAVRRPGQAALRPAAVRRPEQAKLRLTRRGQIVLTLLVTGLLLTVFSLGRFSAGAVGDPVPHRTVVVHSGDTLWSIASKAAPSADPRVTVEKLRLLNHLDGGGVQVGQQLELP